MPTTREWISWVLAGIVCSRGEQLRGRVDIVVVVSSGEVVATGSKSYVSGEIFATFEINQGKRTKEEDLQEIHGMFAVDVLPCRGAQRRLHKNSSRLCRQVRLGAWRVLSGAEHDRFVVQRW